MTAETMLVGLIVAFCAVFSAWRLMSIHLRLKTLDTLSWIPGVAHLHRKTLTKLSGGGCGSCRGAVNANARPANQKPGALRR